MNQNAPSVDYPVGRFAWSAWLVLLLALVSLLAIITSLMSGLFEVGRAAWLCGVWLLLCIFSWITLRSHQAKSWLCWDGHDWQVQSPVDLSLPEDYAIRVHMDLQHHVLVSLFNTTSRRQWFWVSKSSFPERWHGFRCAVYCFDE